VLGAFYRDVEARMAHLPGVVAEGAVSALPLTGTVGWGGINVEGYAPPPGQELQVDQRTASTDYFRAMQISLVAGRFFSDNDRPDTPQVVIIDENFAKRLRSTLAIVFKRRPEPDVSEVTEIVGDVQGKVAVVVDDMISTGGTLAKAAEALIKRGATEVYTCATHGIFAGDAVRVLTESPVSRIIVTNTLPNVEADLGPKFKVLSIAQILADAIKRITANRSVSELFAKDDEAQPPAVVTPSSLLELPEVLAPASSAAS